MCLRLCTGFKRGFLRRDAPMRALWSDRPNCSHNVSQKVKRIRRLSETVPSNINTEFVPTELKSVYHCLRHNCPINFSNLFLCDFPVSNYQIDSRTMQFLLYLFTLLQPEQISTKELPKCRNYRINSGRKFSRYFRGVATAEMIA